MTKLGGRRLGLGLADQALASGTSFLLAVLVARHSTPAEFGAFALAWTAYWISLGVTRALVCEPMLIRYAGLEGARWRVVVSRGAGVALCLGVCFSIACAVAGGLASGGIGPWLLTLAAMLPALLVQDVWRAAFFARSKPQGAFVNDLVWFAVLAAGVGLVETGVLTGGRAALGAWGAAGCVAAVVGAWQTHALPAVRSPLGWWRRVRPLGGRLVTEFVTLTLAGQLATLAVAVVGGLAAAGALRGAQSLLGVMNVLFAGLLFTLVPHGVELARSSPVSVLKLSQRVAVACATAALVLGIWLSLLPDHIGEALLGARWPATRDVLVPLALAFAFAGIVFGATAGLRSLADTKRSLRARVLVAPLTVSGAAVGAVFGAREAAFGLAAAGLVAAAIWWRSLTTSVAASQDAPAHAQRVAARPRYGPPPGRNPRVAATD